jgi:4-oxalomesaconate tautomerase
LRRNRAGDVGFTFAFAAKACDHSLSRAAGRAMAVAQNERIAIAFIGFGEPRKRLPANSERTGRTPLTSRRGAPVAGWHEARHQHQKAITARRRPMQTGIRCMLIRGGTSKAAYFLADDLPSAPHSRDPILLAAMGSPDPRQIDGLGGAHSSTSKVAIVSRSALPDCHVDFLFAEIGVDRAAVDTRPSCSNVLAGVGPFAIERGLVEAEDGQTRVKVHTLNNGAFAELLVETPGGRVQYEGAARIDGVPGTAAPIAVEFLNNAGSASGVMLPTGNAVDPVAGAQCTLIDSGAPLIVIAAADLGRSGQEPPEQLEKDARLKTRLEEIRQAAGPLMKPGEMSGQAVPMIVLVAPAAARGHIAVRSFTPQAFQASIGALVAVALARAACLPGSPAASAARLPDGRVKIATIEHPSGAFSVRLEVGGTPEKRVVERAGLIRTARLLFDGMVFVPGGAYGRAEAAQPHQHKYRLMA